MGPKIAMGPVAKPPRRRSSPLLAAAGYAALDHGDLLGHRSGAVDGDRDRHLGLALAAHEPAGAAVELDRDALRLAGGQAEAVAGLGTLVVDLAAAGRPGRVADQAGGDRPCATRDRKSV